MSSPRRRRRRRPTGRGVGGVPDANKQGYDNIITKEVVLGEVITNIFMSARARSMSAITSNHSFPSRSGARSKHSIGGVPVTVLHTYPRDGTEALPARAGAERTRMCGGRFGKDAGRSCKKGRATVRRTPQRTIERPASSDRCSTPFGRVSPLLPNYELNIGMINARRDVHSCLRRLSTSSTASP